MKKRRQSRREIENRRLCFIVIYNVQGREKNVRPSPSGMEIDEVAVQEVYFWGIR